MTDARVRERPWIRTRLCTSVIHRTYPTQGPWPGRPPVIWEESQAPIRAPIVFRSRRSSNPPLSSICWGRLGRLTLFRTRRLSQSCRMGFPDTISSIMRSTEPVEAVHSAERLSACRWTDGHYLSSLEVYAREFRIHLNFKAPKIVARGGLLT